VQVRAVATVAVEDGEETCGREDAEHGDREEREEVPDHVRVHDEQDAQREEQRDRQDVDLACRLALVDAIEIGEGRHAHHER